MNKKIQAFTLAELMIVLVIIGILVLLALPNLMPLISKAKSTEAKIHLEHIYNLEKSHFYMYSKYTNDLQAIGYQQEELITEGGGANYLLTVELLNAGTYVAKATSVVDFDNDGVYNVWQINERKELLETSPD